MKHAASRELYAYWEERRGRRAAPERAEIEPGVIRADKFIEKPKPEEAPSRLAVSARYILRNDNSGQQESLPSLEAALDQLSQIHGLPVLDKSLIDAERRYEANVRVKIDYGAVPFSVRLLMFWVSDWHRESDWYTWTLQP